MADRAQGTSLTWNRTDVLALGGLVGLALLVRVPHLMVPYVINMDAIEYVEGARAIAGGDLWKGLSISHPSLFPIIIAWLQPLTGDWVAAARVLPLTFGILTVIPLYSAARVLLGRDVAWIPPLLYCICPAIIAISLDVVRDPISWFVLAIFLWVLLKGLGQGRWDLCLCAGGLAALYATVRPDGLILVPAGVGCALYGAVRSRRIALGLLQAGGLLLPVLLLITGVLIIRPGLIAKGGSPHWTTYSRQLRSAISGGDGISGELGKIIADGPTRQTRRFVRIAWENRRAVFAWEFLDHWVRAAHPLMFFLMVLGILTRSSWRQPGWDLLAILMLAWMAMGYIRVSGALAISKRHLIPLVMMGYLYGARGLAALATTLNNRWPRISKTTFLAAVASLVLLVALPKALSPARQDKLLRRQAGEWIRTMGIPYPVILTNRPRVAFYAHGTSVPLRAFFKAPCGEAHLLVVGRKTGTGASQETLGKLESLGWRPGLVKEFRGDWENISIYILSPPADPGGQDKPR